MQSDKITMFMFQFTYRLCMFELKQRGLQSIRFFMGEPLIVCKKRAKEFEKQNDISNKTTFLHVICSV